MVASSMCKQSRQDGLLNTSELRPAPRDEAARQHSPSVSAGSQLTNEQKSSCLLKQHGARRKVQRPTISIEPEIFPTDNTCSPRSKCPELVSTAAGARTPGTSSAGAQTPGTSSLTPNFLTDRALARSELLLAEVSAATASPCNRKDNREGLLAEIAALREEVEDELSKVFPDEDLIHNMCKQTPAPVCKKIDTVEVPVSLLHKCIEAWSKGGEGCGKEGVETEPEPELPLTPELRHRAVDVGSNDGGAAEFTTTSPLTVETPPKISPVISRPSTTVVTPASLQRPRIQRSVSPYYQPPGVSAAPKTTSVTLLPAVHVSIPSSRAHGSVTCRFEQNVKITTTVTMQF